MRLFEVHSKDPFVPILMVVAQDMRTALMIAMHTTYNEGLVNYQVESITEIACKVVVQGAAAGAKEKTKD